MSLDFRERGRWLARNVLPHEPLIRSKLSTICVYDLDIDDVIQEMYARLLSAPSLEVIRFPKQYAIRTAKAIVVDHVRHQRVISITSTESLENFDTPMPEANTEERLEFQGEIAAVADALAQLPVVCSETLILRRMEGLSQREVAKRLNISEKSVERHMSNGVRQLIRIFGRGGKPRAQTSPNVKDERVDDVVDK